jgi:hypothetical protein
LLGPVYPAMMSLRTGNCFTAQWFRMLRCRRSAHPRMDGKVHCDRMPAFWMIGHHFSISAFWYA